MGLCGDEATFSREDREVKHVRLLRGDRGQQRTHVRVADVDGFLGYNLTTHVLEVGCEHVYQADRIRAAVVNSGNPARAERVIREFCGSFTLEVVVEGRAHERADRVRGRQGTCRARRRDHRHVRFFVDWGSRLAG